MTGSKAHRFDVLARGSGQPHLWAGCCEGDGGYKPAAPPSPLSLQWPGEE